MRLSPRMVGDNVRSVRYDTFREPRPQDTVITVKIR
jgi:hypothetical protein